MANDEKRRFMKRNRLTKSILLMILVLMQLFTLPCAEVFAASDVTITLKGLSGHKGYLTVSNATTGQVYYGEGSSGGAMVVPAGTPLSIVPTGINGYIIKTIKSGSDTMPIKGFSFVANVNQTFTVTYEQIKTYAITWKEPANGSIAVTRTDGSPVYSGSTFEAGTVLNVTATPANSNYELKALKAGTLDITAQRSFTVSRATSITATFGLTDAAAALRTVTVSGVTGATGYVTVRRGNATGPILFDNNSGTDNFQIPSGTRIYIQAVGINGYKPSSLKIGSDVIPTDGADVVVYNNSKLTVKFAQIKTYTVTFEKPTYADISVTAGGAALYSGQTVPEGTEIEVTVTPYTDYILSSVKANTTDITTGRKYTVNANTKITADVKEDPASTKVTVSIKGMTGTSGAVIISDINGNVLSDNGASVRVAPGTRLVLKTEGSNGFKPSSLKINNEAINTNGGTITVLADTVISIGFSKIQYITITWTNPINGTIRVTDEKGTVISSGDQIESGTLIRVTPSPIPNYHLSTLTANKEDILPSKTYTCTKNTTLVAKFSEGQEGVSLTKIDVAGVSGVNGDVVIYRTNMSGDVIMSTANGETTVNVPTGTKLFVFPTAAKGYFVSSVKVGGDEVNSKGFYMTALNDATITVKFEKSKTFKVTFTQPSGGYLGVTADGTAINSGDSVPAGTVIAVAATAKSGYSLASLTANGDNIYDTRTYTVTKDTAVAAKFSKGSVNPNETNYCITITGVTGVSGNVVMRDGSSTGTVIYDANSGAKEVYVKEGAKIYVTAEGMNGYSVASMKVDGEDANPDGTTMHVVKDCVVALKFEKAKGYTVTWATPTGGTISASADGKTIKSGSSVTSGTEITVTATPKSGYVLDKLTANGQDITSDYKYIVNKNTKIDSAFTQTEYVLTVKHPTGSKIEVTYVKDGVDTIAETGTKLPVNTVLTVNAEALPGYSMSSLYIHETGNSGKKANVTDGSRFYLETNITVDGVFVSEGEDYKPFIYDSPDNAGWEKITEYLLNTPAGTTVAINMNGATVLPASTGEAIKGRDLVLLLHMDDYYWKIRCKKYNEAADSDMELAVDTDALIVPKTLIDDYANGNGYIEFELSHDGLFGFETELNLLLGEKYKGMYATLLYFDEASDMMKYQDAAIVKADGSANFVFEHASSYVLILSGKQLVSDVSVKAPSIVG